MKIVGEVELADAGGIAAATQILEQERVVEIVALPGIQSQPLPRRAPIQQQRMQCPRG